MARCGGLGAPVGLHCAQQEQECSSSRSRPARGARGAPSLLLQRCAASLPASAGGLRRFCSALRWPARGAAQSCPSNKFLLLFSQGSNSVTRLSRRGFSLPYALPSPRVLCTRAHALAAMKFLVPAVAEHRAVTAGGSAPRRCQQPGIPAGFLSEPRLWINPRAAPSLPLVSCSL